MAAKPSDRGEARRTGLERAQRHDQLLLPRLDPERPFADVRFIEPERRGKPCARDIRFTERGARRREGPAIVLGRDLDEPRLHVQTQRIAAQSERATHMSSAERRVAGERHLVARRENSHRCLAARGGQNERGLGQVELARQRLHGRRVDTGAVLEYTQGIARERSPFAGEHVDQTERAAALGGLARHAVEV